MNKKNSVTFFKIFVKQCNFFSAIATNLQNISYLCAIKSLNDRRYGQRRHRKGMARHVHEDIGAAECMLGGGYLLYVAFLCHQAVEKALKAYYAAYNDDEPPYTHSHLRLLDVCGLTGEISPEQKKFLTLMGPMYIKARYPEQKAKTARTLTKDGCQQMIETTKQLTQWIEERLPETRPSTPSDVTSE